MQPVSNEYKIQINKSTRNPAYVRVTMAFINNAATDNYTASTNSQLSYSTVQNIVRRTLDDITYPVQYARIGENELVLDGGMAAFNEQLISVYQGYLSEAVSIGNGTFSEGNEPTIRFDFSEYVALSGISFLFNDKYQNYPTELTFRAYDNDVLVHTGDASCGSTHPVFIQRIPVSGEMNRLDVVFKKTNFPRRAIMVHAIVFGAIQTFTEENLTSFDVSRGVDLINSKLPHDNCEFTVLDVDRDFDPENPQGMWEFLDIGQPVETSIGYELDDESIEWVKTGQFYFDGESDIQNGKIPQITFSSQSALEYLTDEYVQEEYYPDGIFLMDLAETVIQQASASFAINYSFPSNLEIPIKTKTPLPALPIKECLQLIAGAARCVLFTDRDGVITMARKDYDYIANPRFRLGLDSIYKEPDIKRYPLVKDIVVTYQDVKTETDLVELADIAIEGGLLYYEVEHDDAVEMSFEVSSGSVILNDIRYSLNRVTFMAQGSGEVIFKGKKLVYTDAVFRKNYNRLGEDCPVEMILVNTIEQAEAYADFVYEYVKLRNEYTVNDRGYPELEVLDTIFADTGYGAYNGVIVAESEISYNGALRGGTRYYRLIDYSKYTDNATVVSNGETEYSKVENIIFPDAVVTSLYARAMENSIILDSSYNMAPAVTSALLESVGFTSVSISNNSGVFDTDPTIQIDFENPVISSGLSIKFGNDTSNYATEVKLIAYSGDTLIWESTVANDSNLLVIETLVPEISSMSRLDIQFTKTKFPNRDIQINEIFFGISEGDTVRRVSNVESVSVL